MNRLELLKIKKLQEVYEVKHTELVNLFFPNAYADTFDINLDEEWSLKVLKESGEVEVSVKEDLVGIMFSQIHGEEYHTTLLVRALEKGKKKAQ